MFTPAAQPRFRQPVASLRFASRREVAKLASMEKTQPRSAWIIATAMVLLLLTPVLYFLALGPINAKYPNYYGDMPRWVVTYNLPANWLNRRSPAFGRLLSWYRSCWETTPP
jgi:hypothetical protein